MFSLQKPTALAVWHLGCIMFVALALIAYAGLLMEKARFKRKSLKKVVSVKSMFEGRHKVASAAAAHTQPNMTLEEMEERLTLLDQKFIFIFPLLFLAFNAIYWPLIFADI